MTHSRNDVANSKSWRICSSNFAVEMSLRIACFTALAIAVTACAQDAAIPETPAIPYSGPPPVVYTLEGAVLAVHDPSIIKQGDTYYLFSTGRSASERIPIRCSKDLHSWYRCGDVFSALPDWATRDVPGVKNLWAPDISFFNGKYHLYYSVSTFGSRHSAIGLATNQTLDPASAQYRWQDEGVIIQSRDYDDWNAIDPNIVLDHEGQRWLAFGSFWGGIKLRRLDSQTGRLSTSDTKLYTLAARARMPGSPGAVEAPFIVRRGAFYYLFVSFDFCCKGADSTYKIMVGRSPNVVGPYLDRTGTPMTRGGGTLLVTGAGRWRGPGHNAVLLEAGEDKIIYHAYDAEDGRPKLRIGTLVWDADGWPLAALPNAGP